MKYAPAYIARILFNYFSDELTPEEEVVLNDWVAESEANRRLLEELSDPVLFMRKWERHNRMDAECTWKELQERAPELFQLQVDEPVAERRLAKMVTRLKRFFSRSSDSPRKGVLQVILFILIAGGLFRFIPLIPRFLDRAPVAQTLPQTEVSTGLRRTPTGPSATLQVAGGPVLKLDSLSRGIIDDAEDPR